jgi:hypothetical protein
MIDLETQLRDLARPSTPSRASTTSFEQLERRGRARADRQRRAVVAGSVAAAALLLVALAAVSRASTSDVTSVGPAARPAPPPTADSGWTVNPSIRGTAPLGAPRWTVRVDYDPTVWSFRQLGDEVQTILSRQGVPNGQGDWAMSDTNGQPPADVELEDSDADRDAAYALAIALRGRPGITSVEVQLAHVGPPSPGQGSVR